MRLIDYFRSSFIGSDTVAVAKPDPRPLLEAIERLGEKPKDIFFVGDTKTDEGAAKNANVDFVFCEYGHGFIYKLAMGESAVFKITTFNDLLNISKDKS